MPAVTVEHLQALCASLRPDTPVVVAGQGRVVLVTRAALDTWGDISFNYQSTDSSDYVATPVAA